MTIIHNLGFPRIGVRRELKQALESYWRGETDIPALEQTGRELRARHWRQQAASGLDYLPVGDFSYYDQVLDMSALLGAVPPRFQWQGETVDPDTYFRMARGRAPSGEPSAACEMTKWFDSNYHYLVPELHLDQEFRLASNKLFNEVQEAQALGYRVKPVIIGPLTWLWLAKSRDEGLDKLALLDALLPIYSEILLRLKLLGVEWVQIDEPILALDLPQMWRNAFESLYNRLQVPGLKKLLAVYFGPLQNNLTVACNLPVDGLHVDAVRGAEEIDTVVSWLTGYKVLSVGIVDGRNIWRTDLDRALDRLEGIKERLGERLWLAPSCSLLHVPVDLAHENSLDPEIKTWLAFTVQKLDELHLLRRALDAATGSVAEQLRMSREAITARRCSTRIHNDAVRRRLATVSEDMAERASPYPDRSVKQQARLNLPLYPTTTIGSFPQTAEIRTTRRNFKHGKLSADAYHQAMRDEIDDVIVKQEALGLDVLVHGEPERNDMVEYFGEQLDGFALTGNGWVQSYGSRCVKPPIIYGDVARPVPMTVEWITYAQSLTEKPVKGMLTGPVTLLNWSFVRDDQPRSQTCLQIALALRDEVRDLERAGIRIIQVDEAALREGLPLRKTDWNAYLDWAVLAFRLTSCGVADETQIHTHMCYSEFNDIIAAISAMDADVITIETSRSDMKLLRAFESFDYPNEIGPGVYDIHSPNVPTTEEIVTLMERAAQYVPMQRLWINPDCGLKTRGWPEVATSLTNMVKAAHAVRLRATGRIVGQVGISTGNNAP